MAAVSPVILTLEFASRVVEASLLLSMVGFSVVLQQIPFVTIEVPPVDLIFILAIAVVFSTDVSVSVSKEAKAGETDSLKFILSVAETGTLNVLLSDL